MRRDREHIMDIIEAARLAMEYVKDTSQEDFLKDVQRQDAVVRRLEIVGARPRGGSRMKPARPIPSCRGAR